MPWRLLPILAALLVSAAADARAQRLADPATRHEAIELFRTGRELMSAEKFDRAAEVFADAIQKDPLLTVAHYGLGQAYMNLRRFASAIKAYQGCIEALHTIHTLEADNRFEVEKQRDMEIREMRETIAVLHQKGEILRETQAEQHLHDLQQQGTSIDGPFRPPPELLLSLGSAHFRNGDREAAESEWRAALDANPKLGEAHNNLAVIYMQTGRLDAADAELKLAEKSGFRVNPQFKDDLKKSRMQK